MSAAWCCTLISSLPPKPPPTSWFCTRTFVGAEQELTLVQRGMGRLVGGQDHDIAVLVHIRDRALRLKERVLGPRGLKVLGDDVFGVLDRRLGVAAGDVLVGLHVGFFLVEDARGVLGPGLGGIMDGGQRLVGRP